MIGWIVFIIWILSLIAGIFSGLVFYFEREDWAIIVLVISLIIFLGIPLMILVAIATGLTEAWTQWLQHIIN